jgi:hypothetical protein
MPAVALGTMVVASGTASAHPAHPSRPSVNITGQVTISPSKNIVNGETITINASNFSPEATDIYAVECDPRVIAKQDESWCDVNDADAAVPVTPVLGAATLTMKALTGSSFKATHKGAACGFSSPAHQCWIVVTDSKTPTADTTAGFAIVTFKDTRGATTTKVKGKKAAKTGTKVTFTATTKKHGSAKLSGTVLFRDNGKKVGKAVKEKASGKVTEKIKLKSGKNTITAAYSGSTSYKPSTGKAKATGQKKKKK